MQKISLFHQVFFQIQPILDTHVTRLATPIFEHARPKHLQSTFNFNYLVSI